MKRIRLLVGHLGTRRFDFQGLFQDDVRHGLLVVSVCGVTDRQTVSLVFILWCGM
jgi:hypothetical protein